jgi:hypothetical protein
MFRKHVPDLDILESPLISANPFGSMIGTMPGSALAEKIFNDPEAWEGAEAEEKGDAKEAMAWLEGELEKYHAIGDELGLSPIERLEKDLSEMFKTGPLPSLTFSPDSPDDENSDYIPIFERSSSGAKNLNLRLSRLLDSGNNIFRSFSTPISPVKPPQARCGEVAKEHSPSWHTPQSSVTPVLNFPSAGERTSTPVTAAIPSGSASSTWSILELYGLNPDSPSTGSPRTSVLGVCPPTPPVRRLPPSSLRTTSSSSSRSSRSTPSPPGTPTPLPKPPIQIPSRRAESPVSIRRLPVLPECSTSLPHSRSLEPPPLYTPERTPRTSGSLAPPNSSDLDPFNSSPSPSGHRRSGSGSITRSPPAGPRPRSANSTPANRKNSTDSFTSYFEISPVPAPRTRPSPLPLPLPPLHIGAH